MSPPAERTVDLTEVDFGNLGTTVPPFLQTVSAECGDRVRPTIAAAHRLAHPQEEAVECSLGSRLIPEVQELSRLLTGTAETVDANIRDVADCLARSAGAVTRIADRYRTTEDRNRATAEDIARLLPH